MLKSQHFLAMAALLALALPCHAWHCRYVVVVPAAGVAVASGGGAVYTATAPQTYALAAPQTYAAPAPAVSWAAAPALVYGLSAPAVSWAAAPAVSYQSLATYAVAPPAAAAAPVPVAAAAAPCQPSVTDREIAARLDRMGAHLGTGGGGRLTAVQPMTAAQLTERLAQLAATVEALAQVVGEHGKRLEKR